MQIKTCHENKGLTCPQIARELGMDECTVRKWSNQKRYCPKKAVSHSSILDPFKAQIIRLPETHSYSATQIFQRLREETYDGGYTIVKEYVRKIRYRKVEPFLKLSFAPGEFAQVDWGSDGSVNVGSTSRKLSFFVMVLCYSHVIYVEFTVSQFMEYFLFCHQNAFNRLGVPEKIMVDNLKSAVLKRVLGAGSGSQPQISGLCESLRFLHSALCRQKRQRKGPRGKWRGICQKKLPGRFGYIRFQDRQSRRHLLARYHCQRPYAQGNRKKTSRNVRRRTWQFDSTFRAPL
jgi:transposase